MNPNILIKSLRRWLLYLIFSNLKIWYAEVKKKIFYLKSLNADINNFSCNKSIFTLPHWKTVIKKGVDN